ncbi:MAG: MarR family transcriptional regulator [Burkholderiaceae bacterium]|nr:MarR family transcriptional regulator [Burkholderiaceae bacterium]MDO9089053.1 MarR family transcriptional regulator [Burkholderiaceae bacterium]
MAKPDTPTAADLPLDRTLTYRLHLLHKLSDQESQQAYVKDAGLSMSDGRCLTTIGTFEPLSVNTLARYANLNKGQASRAAQALVEQGLVRKQGDAEDGRGVTLTLSPAGRKVWVKTMAMVHRRNQEIFGCLTAAEQRQLGAFLDRLIRHNEKI